MNLKFTAEDALPLFGMPALAIRYPEFEIRYDEEAKDHLIKVNAWLKATGMDAEWEALVAEPNQLFFDFDVPFDTHFAGQMSTVEKTIQEVYGFKYWGEEVTTQDTHSKSGNKHTILTFKTVQFAPMEAAAWQAAGGSDHKREALHIKSIIMGSKNPNILIERKMPEQKLLKGDVNGNS